jgi:hypothetical protein
MASVSALKGHAFRRAARLIATIIITLMSGDLKFDYGDQVQAKDGKHKDRLGDVVGMTITASSRTIRLSSETVAKPKSK